MAPAKTTKEGRNRDVAREKRDGVKKVEARLQEQHKNELKKALDAAAISEAEKRALMERIATLERRIQEMGAEKVAQEVEHERIVGDMIRANTVRDDELAAKNLQIEQLQARIAAGPARREPPTCSICMHDYEADGEADRSPRLLRCGHGFCLNCIKTFGKKNGCTICPTCNSAITGPEPKKNFAMINYLRPE